MPSSFTTNKSLEQPANGAYVDTWNVPVNADLGIIDKAFGGVTALNATSGSAALTLTQYQALMLSVSGAFSSDVTYTIPAGVGGQWVVINNATTTNGSRIIMSSLGGGTNVVVPLGDQVTVACDGTNFYLVTVVGGSVPTGGGTDAVFYNNGQTVTTNYTIPTSNNSGTFGPVTINSGVTVTVPSGSTWSIV